MWPMPEGPNNLSVQPVTAAEITDEIWLEVARNHAGTAQARVAAERARLASSPVAGSTQSYTPLPLPALVKLEGTAFIEAAYATLLRRAPDEAGLAYLRRELARGRSKIELLGELEASSEAREAGHSIAGLRRRYLAQRFYRVPVIGPIARAGSVLLRRTGISRMLAVDGSSNVALRAEVDTRLAGIAAAMDSRRHALEERVSEQQVAIELITRRLAAVQAAQEELARKTIKAVDDQKRLLSTLTEQSTKFARQLAATEDSVIDSLLALSESVYGHESRLSGVEGAVDVASARAQIEAAAGSLRAELDSRVIAAEAIAAQNRRDVADQQRRIGLMLNGLNAARAMGLGVPPAVDAADDHALDALYIAFEDRFRGTRRAIKERQRVYLPRLRDAQLGTAERPILDIGAGRGEFLELLAEEGLVGSAVDSNATMAALCEDAGFKCVVGDALSVLASYPEASLGAITGFHIIEHLPFKTMVRIMDEALRVLVPGGLLIFETPNPANILTASRWFYLDPTHRNPLPGEMVAMIAEARGFPYPEIMPLHPMTERFPGSDRLLAEALDRVFYGPQDYALIARKP